MLSYALLVSVCLSSPASGEPSDARPASPPPPIRRHHPHDVVDALAFNPSYPDDPTLFVASGGSMNLVLRSDDRGLSWSGSRSGLRGSRVFDFGFDPNWTTTKTVYAAAGKHGLHVSRDGGRTWDECVYERPAFQVEVVRLAGEEHEFVLAAGGFSIQIINAGSIAPLSIPKIDKRISSIAVSTAGGGQPVLAFSTESNHVYVSADLGKNWTDTTIDAQPRRIVLSPDFANDRTVWLATHGLGLMRSTDGGATFAEIDGITDADANDVALSPTWPATKEVFVATRDAGVFHSADGGATWKLLSLAVKKTVQTDNHYTAVRLSPRYPEDPTVLVGAFEGANLSDDRGATWREFNINPTRISRKLQLAKSFPTSGLVFASSYGLPLMISEDHGETWEFRTHNFHSLSSYALGVSPYVERDKLIHIGIQRAIRRSTDGGRSWTKIDMIPFVLRPDFPHYEIRTIDYSPNFAIDRTVAACSRGGFYLSTDAGETWKGQEPSARNPRFVEMSPNFAKDRIIFQAGMNVTRSADGGTTWGGPLVKGYVRAIKCAPDFGSSGEAFVIHDEGFSMTVDSGETFLDLGDPFDGYTPMAMALSPDFASDGTIWVGTLSGGLFRSTDRGRSFQRFSPLGTPVDECFTLALSPAFASDGTMFIGNFDGIWRSTDHGRSWRLTTTREMYHDVRAPWEQVRGEWTVGSVRDCYNGSVHVSSEPGAEMALPFTGSAIQIFGTRGPDQGDTEILLDGKLVARFDSYAPGKVSPVSLWQARDLEFGYHVVTVRVPENGPEGRRTVRVDAAIVDYVSPSFRRESGPAAGGGSAPLPTTPDAVRREITESLDRMEREIQRLRKLLEQGR